MSHALKQSALSAHLSKTFKRPPFAARYSHVQICVWLFCFPAPRSPLHAASVTCECHRRLDNPAPLVIPLGSGPSGYLRIAPKSSGPTLHFSVRLSRLVLHSRRPLRFDVSRRRAIRPRDSETKPRSDLAWIDSNTIPTPSTAMTAWPIDPPGGIRDQPSTYLGAGVSEWSPSP